MYDTFPLVIYQSRLYPVDPTKDEKTIYIEKYENFADLELRILWHQNSSHNITMFADNWGTPIIRVMAILVGIFYKEPLDVILGSEVSKENHVACLWPECELTYVIFTLNGITDATVDILPLNTLRSIKNSVLPP